MKLAEKLTSIPLAMLLFCLTVPPVSATEHATPKQILKATPGTVKEGFERFKYGMKRGKPEREANREKAKQDIKRQNPVKRAHKK